MPDEPSNVKIFNSLCALIFERLYDNFPVRISLVFVDLATDLETIESKTAPEIENLSYVFEETISWLEEEGFIRVSSAHLEGQFSDVVLTMRGFSILGATPSAVDSPRDTTIQRIKHALGRGGAEASTETIKLLVAQVFGTLAN